MLKIKTTIFKDKTLKDAHHPQHEVELDVDKRKGRVINPWNGAWGMAKKSGLNNLNVVVTVLKGEDSYAIYSLRAMGTKVFFKIMRKDLVITK